MLDFIVNPLAGGKNGRVMKQNLAVLKDCLDKRSVSYRIHLTEYHKHAIALTEQIIKDGANTVIAVGGDGTVNEVLNGLSDFENVAMGIIPCGTGNDFANHLKLPSAIPEALDLILYGAPKYTDFMQMPGVRGINIIGAGMDTSVLQKYSKLKKKNKLGYTLCLIRTLCRFDYVSFTAKYNGKTEPTKSFIACVANGNMYGGGINICPAADATDGKLEYLTVSPMPKLKVWYALIKLLSGNILTLKNCALSETEQIEFETEKPAVVNVDGELYENVEFKIQIVKDTLRLYR